MSLADYKPGILMSGTTHAILADTGVQIALPGDCVFMFVEATGRASRGGRPGRAKHAACHSLPCPSNTFMRW